MITVPTSLDNPAILYTRLRQPFPCVFWLLLPSAHDLIGAAHGISAKTFLRHTIEARARNQTTRDLLHEHFIALRAHHFSNDCPVSRARSVTHDKSGKMS
ncbi:hypothetical protein BD293_1016 [Roseinatronobacter monicus]|uniref:Uncharacterized protein n=1 Tax=Roseinatronobacter monicus TaxID=393481 RepID=A0A543KBE8_9RHOB|nr:hypothetical protein BD293_1016 [Roseinatronobacter monicus]